MAISIGLNVRWPDGTAGTIVQHAIRREPNHDEFVASLVAQRQGRADIRGDLWFAAGSLDLLGNDDAVRSNTMGAQLSAFVELNELQDGFSLRFGGNTVEMRQPL